MTLKGDERRQVLENFERFLSQYTDTDPGAEAMSELIQGYPADVQTYAVDYDELYVYDRSLAEDLRDNPGDFLDVFNEALALYDIPADIDLSGATVRLSNPDAFPYTYYVGEFSPSDDSNRLIAVEGQVTKTSKKKGQYTSIVWECQRCGTNTEIPQGSGVQEPRECKGCERSGPFIVDEDASEDRDYQLVRLQQPPERQTGSSNPEKLDVVLTDDLVGEVQPGDRVSMVVQTERVREEEGNDITFIVRGECHAIDHHETDYEDLDITEEDEQRILEVANDDPMGTFVNSILPGHMGDREVKRAIALQLMGGEFYTSPDGSSNRYAIHIGLIGDPSTGKSNFLQYVANHLVPRGVYTEGGANSTAAGLTCAAVQDDFGDGGWTIEGGALVQASGGVCAIDELDKVEPEDYQAMNGAMADGSISPAKGDIADVTLPAQTSVLAAANPKYERFDPYEPIGEQFDIKPSTLSRFDLIFVMRDQPDEEDDGNLAEHILDDHDATLREMSGRDPGNEHVRPDADHEVLQKYVAYAKENCNPVLTEDAKAELKAYWTDLRANNNDEDDPVPVAPRDLEGAVRLARASARLRLSDHITETDARRVIDIVQDCLESVGKDPETGRYDADMVETGRTHSQHQRKKAIKEAIDTLALRNDNGAPEGDLVAELSEEGYSEDEVLDEIELLKSQGEVFEARQGHYRTT